jgi:hypothetical protein
MRLIVPFAGLVELFSAGAMAAINPASTLSNTKSGEGRRHNITPQIYTWDFRWLEDIAQLRAAEKEARKKSLLSDWSVKFEKPQTPTNPLWLFFNSAPLLIKELSKTLPEVVGNWVHEMSSQNLPQVLQKLFETTGDERWLSRTRGTVTSPIGLDEFTKYMSDIARTRTEVATRLAQNERLQTFVIDRFNALYPQMLIHGKVGRKTLQSLLLGSIALWDTAESTRIQTHQPQAVAPSMTPLDYATSIARLAILTESPTRKTPIVRLQVLAPGVNGALTYAIAPFSSVERLLGNTLLSHGITERDAVEHLFAGIRKTIVEMK